MRVPIDFYQNRILEKFASKDPKRLNLKQLTLFARNVRKDHKLLQSANYVREELPIRLAHRIRQFQQLPFVVGTNPKVETIYNLYWQAFEQFRTIKEIKTEQENDEYCKILEEMLLQHKRVVPILVVGMRETKKYLSSEDMNKFLNETLRSRIGRRTLAEQHLKLTQSVKMGKDMGMVENSCKAVEVVKRCIRDCETLFMDTYECMPPEVLIDGHLNGTLTYIPAHLHYILFEILRNAMTNTLEYHKQNLPPILITIGTSPQQFMIRVSDQGGGIPKPILDELWSFVKENAPNEDDEVLDILTPTKKAGMAARELDIGSSLIFPMNVKLGIGLPMAQVYANYWGGSISVYSMDNYGTDAYLTINTLDSTERITYDTE